MRSLCLLPAGFGLQLLELWEKVLPETNHSAVTDHHVWFKTAKWAFEGLVRFEVKKSSKAFQAWCSFFMQTGFV